VRAYNAGKVDEALRLIREVESNSAQVVRCLEALIATTSRKAA